MMNIRLSRRNEMNRRFKDKKNGLREEDKWRHHPASVVQRRHEVLARRMMTSCREWVAIPRGGEARSLFPSSCFPNFTATTTATRDRIQVVRLPQMNMSLPNAKKANLSATSTERIKLPNYNADSVNKEYHISEFLSQPSGIQAMLNTSALQSFHFLDTNTCRCTLPKVQLLNFEAAPVIDLRITPTDKDCTVELLSCKFEGSDIVERQNDHFSAFMINHMRWDTNDSESFLEVDVKLTLSLEIYTRPFSLLPVSAVEHPGNLMMQALVDRLVPLFLQQLLQDYEEWVQQKFENLR